MILVIDMTGQMFIDELQKLIYSLPKPPTITPHCENSEYGNNISYCKNVYFGFDSDYCNNSLYIADSARCDDVIDCDYAVDSQLCYECVDPFKAFNCDYLNYCAHIRDSSYCEWCWQSHDLFGCVNLIGKSFCVFNRQLTPKQYKEATTNYKKWPAEKILKVVADLKKRYPVTQTIEAYNENTTYGNYIHYNKNCYMCFDAAKDENCSYLYDSFYSKMCLDMTYTLSSQLSYEAISSFTLFNCDYAMYSKNCQDSSYIFNCLNVKNCLGCVSLAHKQYCILNKQFSKEEYEQLSRNILSVLRKENSEWASLMYFH